MDNTLKTFKSLSELHPWENNPRDIKVEGYARLKKQVVGLGYYKPNLVMADGTILGGNMRFKVYEELANSQIFDIHDYVLATFNTDITDEKSQEIINKYKTLWVSIIDFVQRENGKWVAVVNGTPEFKEFETKEDGMWEYALSDNDHGGYTDADKLANAMPQLHLDWSDYSAAMYEQPTIAQYYTEDKTDSTDDKKDDTAKEEKPVICPNCNHEFTPQK